MSKTKFLAITPLLLAMYGCSGGSSTADVTPPVSKTAYNVAVSVPDALVPPQTAMLRNQSLSEKLMGFFLSNAYALDGNDLTAANFAVAIVDTSGNVVEVVEIAASDISQNPDGSWEISVPGDPRLDCLIVADLDSPASVTVGSPLPADVVYAPTTAPTIDVDIQSTAAYQGFLNNLPATVASFAELTDISVAEVEAIINSAQTVELPPIGLGQTLEEYVQTAIAVVEEVVVAEVNAAVSSISGNIADAAANGIYWFESEISNDGTYDSIDYIEYGVLQQGVDEAMFQYNGTDFAASLVENDTYLTASGWQTVNDLFTVSPNADGSVTFSAASNLLTIQYSSTSVQAVDVTGLAIRPFFVTNGDRWADIIPADATFSTTGGIAYRSTWIVVNEQYEVGGDISCDPNTYLGSDWCNAVYTYGSGLATTLPGLVSTSAGTKRFNISENIAGKSLSAELVDDGTNKTVVFFDEDSNVQTSTQLTETATWGTVTQNGVEFYRFTAPASLRDAYNIWHGDEGQAIALFANAGFVRTADYYPAGFVEEGTEWLFNATAGQQIVNAADVGLLSFPAP